MSNYPKCNSVYTYRQIHNELELDDSPHLGFTHKGIQTVIQTSHLAEEDLLAIPGMSESLWTYVRTTSEWIPIFRAVDNEAVVALVDIEPSVNHYKDQLPAWWVTPKGFPREQYVYTLRPDKGNVS